MPGKKVSLTYTLINLIKYYFVRCLEFGEVKKAGFIFLFVCMVFNAALNKFSFIIRRFLGNLSVLLVHLTWPKRISPNANPTTLRSKEGKLLLLSLWYDSVGDRTRNLLLPKRRLYHLTTGAVLESIKAKHYFRPTVLTIPLTDIALSQL